MLARDRKVAYAEMIEVLRAFLGRQLGGDATDLTTGELLAWLDELPAERLAAARRAELAAWLDACEEVKFGGYAASVDDGRAQLAVVAAGQPVQTLVFERDGNVSFALDTQPVLGMGEGGPLPAPGSAWRSDTVQFDRRDSHPRARQLRWLLHRFYAVVPGPSPFMRGGARVMGLVDYVLNGSSACLPGPVPVLEHERSGWTILDAFGGDLLQAF